jgi:hypothetical protein
VYEGVTRAQQETAGVHESYIMSTLSAHYVAFVHSGRACKETAGGQWKQVDTRGSGDGSGANTGTKLCWRIQCSAGICLKHTERACEVLVLCVSCLRTMYVSVVYNLN